MHKAKEYILTSERLGFREWVPADFEPMAEINMDKEVMEFFPATLSPKQTREFIERMQHHLKQKGFCYFAVDKLEDGTLIGCIGLSEKTFESAFTPCIDIGWRLKKTEWSKGYATEGAKRCLDYAFNNLNIEKVSAIAPKINLPSQHVMKKIGMTKVMNFKHPQLTFDERLRECVLYEITKHQLPLTQK